MSTTLLFAELLVIGLQVVIWSGLFLNNLNAQPALLLQQIAGSDTVSVLIVIMIAYSAGIMFDRLADLVFSRWDATVRAQVIKDSCAPAFVTRFIAEKDSDYLSRIFEYTKSRMRIARASALNIPLIFGGWIWSLLDGEAGDSTILHIPLVAVVGILLTGLSVFAWYRLTETYWKSVQRTYQALIDPQNSSLSQWD